MINITHATHTAHKDCIHIVAIFHRNIATLQIHCKMLLHHCCGIAAMIKCPLLGILQQNIIAILQCNEFAMMYIYLFLGI